MAQLNKSVEQTVKAVTFSDVDNTHPEYQKLQSNWLKNQDANDGQEAIKTSIQNRRYLPPLEGHKTESDGDKLYCTYSKYAVWFNATGRTVDGLLGLVFRKDPIVEIPEDLDYMLTDCNTRNQTLDDFSKELFEQVLLKNRVGLLIDFPTTNTAILNKAEYERLNLRPYFTQYKAEAILNWRENKINNQYQTTFVTLAEIELVAGATEFKNETVQRVRVLDFDEFNYYRQRVYERQTISESVNTNVGYDWALVETIEPAINGKRLKYIPFYSITERGVSWDIEYSAINDLSDMNIAHYRNSANYENALILTGNPTPCLAGFIADPGDNTITLGSSRTLIFGENAKWGFLSLDGEGLVELRTAQQMKEGQMALLGARIISPEKRQTETAEAANIHRQGEQGVLANIANSISAAITEGLKVAGEWQNLSEQEIEGIEYQLNIDYTPSKMSERELATLLQAWQSGAISDEEFYRLLKLGEIIEADKTLEEHQHEIENSAISTTTETDNVEDEDEDEEIDTTEEEI